MVRAGLDIKSDQSKELMRCTKDNGKKTRDMAMVKFGIPMETSTVEASRMIKKAARAV